MKAATAGKNKPIFAGILFVFGHCQSDRTVSCMLGASLEKSFRLVTIVSFRLSRLCHFLVIYSIWEYCKKCCRISDRAIITSQDGSSDSFNVAWEHLPVGFIRASRVRFFRQLQCCLGAPACDFPFGVTGTVLLTTSMLPGNPNSWPFFGWLSIQLAAVL